MPSNFQKMEHRAEKFEGGKDKQQKEREEQREWRPDDSVSGTRADSEQAYGEREKRIKQQGPDWD